MVNVPTEFMVFFGGILMLAIGAFVWALNKRIKTELPVVTGELTKLFGDDMWRMLGDLARQAVLVAQQARLNEWIENTGEAAKDEAVRVAQDWLDSIGAEEISAESIANLIEAAYSDLKFTIKQELDEWMENKKPSEQEDDASAPDPGSLPA